MKVWAIVIAVFVVIALGVTIYVYITYGNKPITEIPAWAATFFVGGGR